MQVDVVAQTSVVRVRVEGSDQGKGHQHVADVAERTARAVDKQ